MSRTIGARDLRRRKIRSDRGKHRKVYNGKPTKMKRRFHGKLIPYKSTRRRHDPIKIWFQEVKRMSKQGYSKLDRNARKHFQKTVKVWIDRPVSVELVDISTPEKIGEMAIRILQYPGLFNLTMPSASKSSWRVSYKKKAVVRITETEEGLNAKVFDYSKMRHYSWFFKG